VERELRAPAPSPATGAVEQVPLEEISGDDRFQLRDPGDVAGLATSIGRLGQLVPVELRLLPGSSGDGPRWQVVAGFRRLAALRMLHRDAALARLHRDLPDEDAWALALCHALVSEPLSAQELELLRRRIEGEGVAPWSLELVVEALARAPVSPELRERFLAFLQRSPRTENRPGAPPSAPEPETVEVTPEELVADLSVRLYQLNEDMAAAWDAWSDLPAEGRRQIVEQVRYLAELFPFLDREEP